MILDIEASMNAERIEEVSVSGDGGGGSRMVVPSSEVETFLATLKSYIDSCAASRAALE